MLKALAIVLLVLLLVLVGMNFLVVSNVGDRLRAAQADVDQLKAQLAGGGPAAGVATPFDVETATAFAGETPAEATVTLGERPVRLAVVALTEIIDADGKRVPVPANAVDVLPGVPGTIALGREAGCLPVPGAPLSGWVLSLEGGSLRVASRGCAYARPLRGRLRGLATR